MHPDYSGGIIAFVVVGALTLCLLVLLRQPTAQPQIRRNMAPKNDLPPPPKNRLITQSELAEATGANASAALYIAVKDPYSERIVVFDVSKASDFYGPGSPYHVFAGRNATHGLAKSSVDPSKVQGDLSKLSASERDTHMQWFAKYTSKYPQVGFLVEDDSCADESIIRQASHSTTTPSSATTNDDKKEQ